jgi:hypothetical protein
MTGTSKVTSISTFRLGMNTRLPDYKLKQTEPPYGVFMREIVNADISEAGSLKLRRGYTKALDATVAGSMWADDAQAYFASGTTLFALTDVAGVLTPAAVTGATLAAAAPVSFASAPSGGAYWTDGVSLGYVLAGVSVPVAPPTPTVLPVVTATVGTLDAGIYSIAFTYVDADGRESPASQTQVVALPANSGLTFTLSAAPAAAFLRCYVSLPNGVAMYRAITFASAVAATLTTMNNVGSECKTVGLANLPAGRFVRYNNGRLMVASGAFLFYSLPYSPLYDPRAGFIPLPAPISVIECLSNEGIYLVADQTYWLNGDLDATKLISISSTTGVMGSGCAMPDTNDVAWMSSRGVTYGSSAGKVSLLQDDKVAVTMSTSGASGFVERDGSKQIVTVALGTAVAVQASGSSYSSAEFADTSVPFDAWVVKVEGGASRRYANYQFTSFAKIAGRYYGTKPDGVYLLEGATDAGAPINFSLSPGRQDWNSPMRKRMESAYVSCSSTGPMKLTVTDDVGNAFTYTTRRYDETIMKQRLDIGRGLDGNFMNFTFTNDGGCAFEMTGYELSAVETTRRIAG